MLKVKNLIENLSRLDQEAFVALPHPDYGYDALEEVQSVTQVKARTCGRWFTKDDEYGKDKVVIIE